MYGEIEPCYLCLHKFERCNWASLQEASLSLSFYIYMYKIWYFLWIDNFNMVVVGSRNVVKHMWRQWIGILAIGVIWSQKCFFVHVWITIIIDGEHKDIDKQRLKQRWWVWGAAVTNMNKRQLCVCDYLYYFLCFRSACSTMYHNKHCSLPESKRW